MKIIYNHIIPFKGFVALNLFGIIFARKEHQPLKKRTLNHEAIHTAQQKELLYLGFYLWYGIEWFIKLFVYGRGAYQKLSFEREAYAGDKYPSYLSKRKKYQWIKYLF